MIAENITAKKHLGQNFLRNKNILNTIVNADDLSSEDIIEIGP
ncbi:MAG: rRNA adenine N-6-methyltransferase family protein [bacterium]